MHYNLHSLYISSTLSIINVFQLVLVFDFPYFTDKDILYSLIKFSHIIVTRDINLRINNFMHCFW